MLKFITLQAVILLTICPIIVVALNKSDNKWKSLSLFFAYYFFYVCLLFLPINFPELRFIDTQWNWSGKTYAIIGSLLFYFLFKNVFKNYNYITIKQKNKTSRSRLIVLIVLYLITIALAVFAIKNTAERSAQLWFQFTMPGLDEELAFRGIMLGLLSNSLKPKIYVASKSLGNPALLITSIIFGLVHSFFIDPNWGFHQNWFEFFNMFGIGLLLGWITLKSGSILMPILAHNLINTLPKLFFWMH